MESAIRWLIGIAVVAVICLIYGLSGWTSIDAGEVGILMKQFGSDKGMQKETLSAGSHWIEPFSYDVYKYDTRLSQQALLAENAIPANTADGQPIRIEVSFQVGLQADRVPQLHASVGRAWWDQVVLPLVRSTVRNEAAKVSSDHVYTGDGRLVIQRAVDATLQAKLQPYGILIDTNLRDISFLNREFVATLEKKAEAEQLQEINRRQAVAAIEEANRVKNVAEGQRYQVEQQAQAERERLRLEGEGNRLAEEERAKGILAVARAEAEGTKLKNDAMNGPGGKALVELEWARNLSPKLQVLGIPMTPDSQLIFTDAMKPFAITSNGGK